MTGDRTWQRWRGPMAATGVVVAALTVGRLLVGDAGLASVLVNESPSLPRGLYLRTGAAVERGSIVAIAQPQAARPYLARLGMPGEVLLLKRAAAVGGERVCAADGWIRTPGGQAKALERDGRGAALPRWSGCRRLAREELFLLGDTPGSFDSRYFGPVTRDEAAGVYREVLTW